MGNIFMLLFQAMIRNSLFCALVASALICSLGFGLAEAAENPARALIKLYGNDIREHKLINPYIVSILAMNELEEGRNLPMVKRFIIWYFGALNNGDKDGLTGTIYDFRVSKKGRLVPTGNYDSVDGYAGSFLHLLRLYYERTGDKTLLVKYWSKIEDIVYLIAYLQDKDGLTRATAKLQAKYLMDNAESYAGVSAFLKLSEALGKGKNQYYEDVRAALRTGIQENFYDAKRCNYYWALMGEERFISNWTVLYPDAYAHVLLFAYDRSLFDGFTERMDAVWGRLISSQGEHFANAPIEQRILFQMASRRMGLGR
jgi:hypothetical protein